MPGVLGQRWKFLLLVGLLAFAARLVVAEFLLRGGRAILPDSILYWSYARSLSQGEFHAGDSGAHRTPGYPWFMYLCWKTSATIPATDDPDITGSRAIVWGQSLLSAGGLLLLGLTITYWPGREKLPATSECAVATLIAFDPLQLGMSAVILSESLFSFLLVAGSAAGFFATISKYFWQRQLWAGLTGLCAGAIMLVRPSAALLAPLALGLWLPIWRPVRWQLAIIAILACLLVLVPWWVRNGNLYGQFVPFTLNLGESLYDGLNPQADGGSNMTFVDEYRKEMDLRQPWQMREWQADRHFRKAAWEWAMANPNKVLKLAWIKAGRYWSLHPNAEEFRQPVLVWTIGIYSFITWGFVIIGIVGLWRLGYRWLLVFAWLPILYFAAVHLIFVSSLRYRIPAMPMWELCGGVGAAWFWEWLTHNRSQTRGG